PLFRSHFLRYGFIGNYFWYHPQIHFDRIWSCEGQINTCVFLTSNPGYALCSSVFPGWNTLQKWKKSFYSMTLPAILPKDTSYCAGKLLLVSTRLLVVLARFLHAF